MDGFVRIKMNAQKENNRKEAREILKENKIIYESFNNDMHWKIGRIDFYPTTLRWIDNGTDIKGIGYNILIDYIKESRQINDNPILMQLSVEQMFDIAKKVKPTNLLMLCAALHKAIYKGE